MIYYILNYFYFQNNVRSRGVYEIFNHSITKFWSMYSLTTYRGDWGAIIVSLIIWSMHPFAG